MTALFPTSLHAQTQKQKALVRTRVSADMKGGDPIPGAEVKLKGGNRYTSDTNGMFSFPVRGNFEIESAHKDGYVMIDPKYLKNFTSYSNNAIPVIMEERGKLNRETERQMTRINRELAQTNERLMNQNDSLRGANAISQAKYDSLEQVRRADYERNSKVEIIQELASYYANLDFQIMQEIDRKFYAAMSEGDYNRALNLINSGKSIAQFDKEIADGKVAINKVSEELDSAKHGLAALEKEAADICYRWVEYYKARFIIDSAAYYLEKRCSYDTLNTEWRDEALDYIFNRIGDYEKALNYCHKALDLIEREENVDFAKKARWYNKTGVVYSRMANYDSAFSYLSSALKISKELGWNDQLASIYMNIGLLYMLQGEYANAIGYTNKALLIREDENKKDSLEIASLYCNLGAIYAQIDSIGTAMTYLNKSLKIREIILGLYHPDVALIYNNIGSMSLQNGDFGMALYYFSKSLHIREKVLSEYHPDVAISYCNIGAAYERMKNFNQALACFNKALDVQRKVLGEYHPNVALSYHNIGSLYADQGNYDSALLYLKRELSIIEKVHGKENANIVNTRSNVGYVYFITGDYISAIEYFKRSLSIIEKEEGNESPNVYIHYYYIGSAYFALGNCQEALDYIGRVVAYCEKKGLNRTTSELSLETARKDIEMIKEKMKNGGCVSNK